MGLFLESFHKGRLDEVSSVLAEHFHQASMPEKEARYRLLATHKAIKVGARETAIYHLDQLEKLLETENIALVNRSNWAKQLYGVRGTLYALVPLPDLALSDLKKLECIARTEQDTCTIAEALCGRAILEHALGNFNSTLNLVAKVEELISGAECEDTLADCKLVEAKAHRDLAQYNQAIEVDSVARTLHRELGNLREVLDASSQVAYGHHAQGQYATAEKIWLDNLTQARENLNVPAERQASFNLGFLNW
jgi:tetratricopeptide (TPR) repeat protein